MNQSFYSGIFPDFLKMAKVCPLFKKDDMSLITNYRPISLLPCFSKVFEKYVHQQLYDYFNANRLFVSNQYGFRPKHSTELATLEFIDRILKLLDNDQIPFSIFMDLSKAFDTLDHSILLHKLSYYGVTDSALHWFTSYLSDRVQYVDFLGTCSSTKNIHVGVPQGSILGPLLFLIYINDLNCASSYFNFIFYADDTTITSTVCTFNTQDCSTNISMIVNVELDKIFTWLCANRLSLNVSKTKYMIFHPSKRKRDLYSLNNLQINNMPLIQVDEFNFLGTTISSSLSWKPHVTMLCKKLSRTIGILKRLQNMLPTTILLTIYNSLFLPYLHQSILLWGHDSGRIFKLQKRAIRLVFKKKYNAHTDPLFKANGLLKFEDIYRQASLKFYHKYTHNQLPVYFSDMFSTIHEQHNYDTRNNAPHHQISRKVYTSKCIRYSIPKLILDVPINVSSKITTHSLYGLGLYVKKYFCTLYKDKCTRENCYVCGNNSDI